MVSSSPALAETTATSPPRRRWWSGFAKAVIGAGILVWMLFWGEIDPAVLGEVAAAPIAVVTCLLLVLLTLPLTALRWGVLLRALGISLSFVSLFHFVAIGTLTNTLLPGSTGGDAVRGVYAWRAVGRGARVGLSVIADRVLSLFAVLFIPLIFIVPHWNQVRQSPALAALATSVVVAVAACIVGACALLAAPRLIQSVAGLLLRWPRLANLLERLGGVIVALRGKPLSLLAAFALAVATQLVTVLALIVIGSTIRIGNLSIGDYIFAAPLTLLANALPLTPNGIGVGEAAFDQICRWLEPSSGIVAYSSIFFAFRLVSMLICLPGLVSLVMYRKAARTDRRAGGA